MSERKKEGKAITLKCRFKSICIFGETNFEKDREFVLAAKELENALAARKINFIYGGDIEGLKGTVAISASINGSKGLSVRVKELEDHIFFIGQELQVSNLPEQIRRMFYHAEAFIALPNGLETLDGISSIAYWAKLNFHKKPLGLLNVNDFYDDLLYFFDRAVETGFIPQVTHHSIISAPTANQLQTNAPKLDLLVKQIGGKSSDKFQIQNLATTLQKYYPDTTLRL